MCPVLIFNTAYVTGLRMHNKENPMRIFLAIISLTLVTGSAFSADLSEGEIKWGKAAQKCLKETAPQCMVKVKENGSLGLWCPAKTPEFQQALSNCDQVADAAVRPVEWTPEK